MLNYHTRMDQQEIARLLAMLRQASWVTHIRYPGTRGRGEISVQCQDGTCWRIRSPLHFVRLKFRYDQARA